jgi:hypothetical protein
MGDVRGRLSIAAGELEIEPETHDAMVREVLAWAARNAVGPSGAAWMCDVLGLDPRATQRRSET